jgi:hypothetical protein
MQQCGINIYKGLQAINLNNFRAFVFEVIQKVILTKTKEEN